jgi:Protein of unknown function (DUF1566)
MTQTHQNDSTLYVLRRLAGPLWAWLCIAYLGGFAPAPAHAQKNATLAAQHADGVVPHGPRRYVLLPGGIARDKTTKLEWLRCALGQTWDGKTCQGDGIKYTFVAAEQAVKDFNNRLGLVGHSAWRIPSHRQLFSLVYCAQGTRKVATDLRDGAAPLGAVCHVDGKGGPTLVQSVFPNTPGGAGSWFWSSSPQVGVADHAWFIQFFSGYVNAAYLDNPYYLYLVRPTQGP